MKDKRKLLAEGIDCQKFIGRCAMKEISLMNIQYISDHSLTFFCYEKDYRQVEKLAGNVYRLTTLAQSGPKYAVQSAKKSKKAEIFGMLLFVAILFYQNLFISRIDVVGCETIDEKEILAVLARCGLYEGCRKNTYDPEDAEYMLYKMVDNIAWAELRTQGGLVTVDISESVVVEPLESDEPCNVVAEKEGIIEEVVAINGVAAVSPGDYVSPGAILISGLNSVKEGEIQWLTHAKGQVFARTFYALETQVSPVAEEPNVTGSFVPGIRIRFGDFFLDTGELFQVYDHQLTNELKLVDTKVPLPVNFTILGINETQIEERERSEKEIQRMGEIQLLSALKKFLPEDAKIAKKDLKFTSEENIIKVTGVFEVIEKIGIQAPLNDQILQEEGNGENDSE